MTPSVDPLPTLRDLVTVRQQRLRKAMGDSDVGAVLTACPINILYATGARNMTVFGMGLSARFVLLFHEGPCILFEFGGSEKLYEGLPGVDEVRTAPAVSARAGVNAAGNVARFAGEIAAECIVHLGPGFHLAVERVEFDLTDALRAHGARLHGATAVFSDARRIKDPLEVTVIRESIRRVESAVASMAATLDGGMTEVRAWAEFQRAFIETEGEFITTRLFQGGPNTFPYFQEAGPRQMHAGELVCIDTDAIGFMGYGVDFSRTFVLGDTPTPRQRELHLRSLDQLETNGSLLKAGLSYESFARSSWKVPGEHAPYAYYALGHGLGMCGEFPNVPGFAPGESFPLPGEFEEGMVFCVESYIGDSSTQQGVKLEDQFLITATGAERLSTFPFTASLS